MFHALYFSTHSIDKYIYIKKEKKTTKTWPKFSQHTNFRSKTWPKSPQHPNFPHSTVLSSWVNSQEVVISLTNPTGICNLVMLEYCGITPAPHVIGPEEYPNSCIGLLTHLPRGKMAIISQTKFVNTFSWMKMLKLWFRFHGSLFLRVKLTISQHWFR